MYAADHVPRLHRPLSLIQNEILGGGRAVSGNRKDPLLYDLNINERTKKYQCILLPNLDISHVQN